MSFEVAEFKESAVELQEIYDIGVVPVQVLSIEDLVVLKVDLYLLVHLSQLYFYIEFSLIDKRPNLERLALCFDVSRVDHLLLSSRCPVIVDIRPVQLLVGPIIGVISNAIEGFRVLEK
jgi:uncharacterized membrane protein